jgi:phosphoribosylformylglycinamidine cyclo-ligase
VCGKLQSDVVLQLVRAMNEACKNNDALLVGGETSEQPGVLEEGAYILSSSVVGVVEKSEIIDGSAIRAGDVVIAVPSNGLHTNGYSLVRALMKQHPSLINEQIASGLSSHSFLDAILVPHTAYQPAFKKLFADAALRKAIHGIAHITGGGIAGNLNRVLPADLSADIELSKIRPLPLFKRIRELGNVPDSDMLKTFNMGVGMTMVVAAESAGAIISALAAGGHVAYPIGVIARGDATIRYSGAVKW